MAKLNASLNALGAARGQSPPYTLTYGGNPTSLSNDFEANTESYINGADPVGTATTEFYSLVLNPGVFAAGLDVTSVTLTWEITSDPYYATLSSTGFDGCTVDFAEYASGRTVVLKCTRSADLFGNPSFFVTMNIAVESPS